MKFFLRSFKAEWMKYKKSSFPWIHILAPAGIAAIFLMYYSFSGWKHGVKVRGYYSVLGMCFPIIIGLLCAMFSDSELKAGNYQNMLMAQSRVSAFFSKVLILWLGGVFSITVASFLFGLGNVNILKQSDVSLGFYGKAAGLMLSASVILYIFHLFLALRFQKSVTIIAGIVEGLISMLFRTGLGENCWMFLPCSYSSRLVPYEYIYETEGIWLDSSTKIAVLICIVLSVLAILLFGIWASKWEGTHTEE